MTKHDLLKLPDDLEGNLRKLLATPPPPHDTPGSRKAAPKPAKKPKAKAPKRRSPPKPEATEAAIRAQARYKREQLAKKLTGKKR